MVTISHFSKVSKPKWPGWLLWLLWTVSTALAAVVGWLLSAGIGFITLFLGLAGAGAVVGFCVGCGQLWLIYLYSARDRASRLALYWLIASIIGGQLGWGAYGLGLAFVEVINYSSSVFSAAQNLQILEI